NTQFDYTQANQGPCSGDSGGPNLVDLGAGERVAGVTSYGDEACTEYGVSGRASSVYNFITDFTGIVPPSTTTAASSTSAGVGGAGGTGAAVGSGGAPSGFFA